MWLSVFYFVVFVRSKPAECNPASHLNEIKEYKLFEKHLASVMNCGWKISGCLRWLLKQALTKHIQCIGYFSLIYIYIKNKNVSNICAEYPGFLRGSRAQWSALQRLPLSPSSSLSVPCDNNNSSTERSCTFQLIFLLSFLLLSLIIVPPLAPLP